MNKLPWDVNPSLDLQSLVAVGRLIEDVRNSVVDDLDVEAGDTFFGQWTPGSKFHSRFAHRVVEATKDGAIPGLSVLDRRMQFTFGINGVPLRLFRGDAERPTKGARKKNVLEALAQQEAFDLDLITKKDLQWVWRMAVLTDPETMRILRITLCQVHLGDGVQVRYPFDIPFREAVAPVTVLTEDRPEGIELEPAEVGELEDLPLGEQQSLSGTGPVVGFDPASKSDD